jgi:hypothetical protein
MNQKSPAAHKHLKRFVILRHYFPDRFSDDQKGQFFDHYDLMLEQDSKLATWQLKAIPELGQAVPAQKLADHREVYLDYEGPIAGGRGSVEQVMTGTFEVCQRTDSCLEVVMTSGDESMRLKIVSDSLDEAADGATNGVTISRIAI